MPGMSLGKDLRCGQCGQQYTAITEEQRHDEERQKADSKTEVREIKSFQDYQDASAVYLGLIALAINFAWAVTVELFSVVPFALVFSYWKRRALISGIRDVQSQASPSVMRQKAKEVTKRIWSITFTQLCVWLIAYLAVEANKDSKIEPIPAPRYYDQHIRYREIE